jgi:hypothetical protein
VELEIVVEPLRLGEPFDQKGQRLILACSACPSRIISASVAIRGSRAARALNVAGEGRVAAGTTGAAR